MRKIAKILSIVFNPLVVGIPVMIGIGIADMGGFRFDAIPSVTAVITVMCIIPLVYVKILLRKGIIKNFHISDRRQRIYLFPVLMACFAVSLVILYFDPAISRLVVAIMGFGLLNCILCALISVRFKISLHCAGVGGLLAGAIFPFGWAGFIAGAIILFLTAWSRVYLKEHSRAEVAVGSVFGTALRAILPEKNGIAAAAPGAPGYFSNPQFLRHDGLPLKVKSGYFIAG